MAALSNVHAASILNTSLRSGTYYLALFLTDPTASGTGTEASGGGYARKVISFDAPTLVSGRQQVKNTDAVDEEHYSPAAVCALLREEENLEKYHITFCRATVYKYIDDGNIFPNVTNQDLPERGDRKRGYKKVREKKPPRGRSIEERDPEIEKRDEPGHWEMDTVVGKKRTKARLLVLSERATRREIIIRIKDGRAETVQKALDRLERLYGAAFYKIFKTITVDNGSEFGDGSGIEKSCRRKAKRTTVYFCHPYTSCERGTNENINRMIRRRFPKGTDFDSVTASQVREVEDWINNYPREILGYKSASFMFKEAFPEAA